jgi:hypothetical protein
VKSPTPSILYFIWLGPAGWKACLIPLSDRKWSQLSLPAVIGSGGQGFGSSGVPQFSPIDWLPGCCEDMLELLAE